MKNPITGLNKHFESRIRLGVMSVLMVNDQVDVNGLKDLLEITDGNLASHIKALESHGYITVHKSFVMRKPKTTYTATKEGKTAFEEHLKALEKLLNIDTTTDSTGK